VIEFLNYPHENPLFLPRLPRSPLFADRGQCCFRRCTENRPTSFSSFPTITLSKPSAAYGRNAALDSTLRISTGIAREGMPLRPLIS